MSAGFGRSFGKSPAGVLGFLLGGRPFPAAEMERDLLVQRTQAGLARAKSEGKTLGRPSKTTAEQRADIIAKYEQGESVSALARLYAVSRANILGVVKPN